MRAKFGVDVERGAPAAAGLAAGLPEFLTDDTLTEAVVADASSVATSADSLPLLLFGAAPTFRSRSATS